MAEEEVTQTPDETGAEQSQANELDSFLGDESSEKQGETPVIEEDKEAKKKRDFEAWQHKLTEEDKRIKSERAELDKLRATQPQPSKEEIESEPGVKVLKDLIREEMKSVVAPVLESTRAEQEAKVWSEFQQKEHVNALLPQIQEVYSQVPKTGNLANDLENARLITIGKYHTQIARAANEAGQEQGFKDRTFKGAQAGITGRPAQSGKTDDFAKRYRAGQITAEELRERADEVTLIEKEDMERDLGK